MSDFSVRFGDYNFTGIAKGGVRELHGPERDIAIARTVGTRGVKILASTDEEKIVEVSGILERDTADDLVSASREFTTAMGKKAQPLVFTSTDGEGEYVYDGAWCTNWKECIDAKENDFSHVVEYRAQFIAPKGFARSTTQTAFTLSITDTPYTTTFTLDGDADPEPIIQLTFEDASTISDITISNLTTNETIQLLDLTLIDDDIIYIDTGLKEVRLNTTVIRPDGVFPSFVVGDNNIQVTVSEDTSGITEQQLTYDSEFSLYGARMISQKITAAGSGARTAIEALIKRVASVLDVVYQEFTSNYNGFTVAGESGPGQVWVSGGQLEVRLHPGMATTTLTQNADLSSAGDGIRVDVSVQQGGNSGDLNAGYVEYTDLTDYIRVRSSLESDNRFNSIISTAYYGSLSIPVTGNGEFKIIQVGANIEVYWAGVLKSTILATTLKANSRVKYGVIAGVTAPNHIKSAYVYRIVNSNTNGDITVEIQTNSAGEPSGTPVTNGTLTIPASTIGTDNFSAVISSFATAPSLTDTTVYHIVVSQSGGDTNNYYLIKKSSSGGYSGGNILTSIDSGANWTDVPGEDTYFRIYGDVPASFDITFILSYFKSLFNVG